MHVSLQLGYQNNCDIETALLGEDFNVVEGVDKCQYVELQKVIWCIQNNIASRDALPKTSSTDKRPSGLYLICRNSFRRVMAAWLNASQRSRDGVGINMSANVWIIQRFEQSQWLYTALYNLTKSMFCNNIYNSYNVNVDFINDEFGHLKYKMFGSCIQVHALCWVWINCFSYCTNRKKLM